ncbi:MULTISPECIES: DUF4335 domain-containing protein [Spirulina sp. CCY15215]|uniref:DUF4335 domain-containing protein n=1 Tax=Spirulina sp. CCY15215 TaxID=2767591 RepID=UPI001951A573|nr:DUF4335 domain-containing protein [Spirulina major]
MTIKRQYNLPNCRLVLEGLDNENLEGNPSDRRPLLSILVHAECSFTGIEQPLSGGKDFLYSLVKAVSAYAQEFLSGIRHPVELEHPNESVRLLKGNNPDIHHLLWQHKSEGDDAEESKPLHFDLNTIQLFDLVEAVDQLFADTRTLPDLSLHLIPVSRRHRKADIPLTKRATPMITGIGSLAIAASLLFILPIPKVKDPEVIQGETSSENAPEESQSEPSAPPISPEDLQALLTDAPKIEEPTEISFLQRYLRREIENAWDNREAIQQNLTYQITATLDGSIIDYEPTGETTEAETELTPLAKLRFLPTEDDIAQKEAIAEFEFTFTRNGTTIISPLAGRKGNATLGERIEDPEILRNLREAMREKLQTAWTPETPVVADLPFRIGVTETGEIADYEYLDGNAYLLQQETPLPKLLNPQAAGIGEKNGTVVPQKALAQFRVVFLKNGAIELGTY